MQFECVPVLDKMIKLYQIQDQQERFKKYLAMLQDQSTSELILPIDVYNPMAKEQLLNVLHKLKELDAEHLVKEVLVSIVNANEKPELNFEVVLNVADTKGGAWTNRFTTEHNIKFKDQAKRKRGFITPVIWVDEVISEQLIIERTKASVYRTIHQVKHSDPVTLEEHVAQETFVYTSGKVSIKNLVPKSFKLLDEFYRKHRSTDNYNIIFNFFFGDEASELMGFKKYGIVGANGFDYCQYLSTESANGSLSN